MNSMNFEPSKPNALVANTKQKTALIATQATLRYAAVAYTKQKTALVATPATLRYAAVA